MFAELRSLLDRAEAEAGEVKLAFDALQEAEGELLEKERAAGEARLALNRERQEALSALKALREKLDEVFASVGGE